MQGAMLCWLHLAPPLNESVELSITLNAYREAESLALLLGPVLRAAAALTPHFEVLVVDAQEPLDATPEVCGQHGVRYVPRKGGDRYGDATRTAIREARGRYLLNLDADGSHDPADFARLWAERERFDIVIGSRYVSGGRSDNPVLLQWISRALNWVFRRTLPVPAQDLSNSFRLYRREVLLPLTLVSQDFDILEEILVRAVMGMPPATIGEVPVSFGRRKAGSSKRRLLPLLRGYWKTQRRLRRWANEQRAAEGNNAA